MTISQCLYFRFNNQSSLDYNIINCKIDSGLYQEPFLPPRSLIEQKIRGRSYFQEVQEENLQFSLTFAYQSQWSNQDLRNLARWLSVDYYTPLIFYNDLTPSGDELIYFAMPVDASQIFHTGNNEGYVTVNFKTNAPHGFTHSYQSQTYECRTEQIAFTLPFAPTTYTSPTTIQIENSGDKPINPLIYVKSYMDYFTITNLTNGGQKMSFSGLNANETLTIDCENEDITSDVSDDTYRYDNMDGDFLELVRGINTILVQGNVDIQFEMEMKRYQ